jgi:hypothetical protein
MDNKNIKHRNGKLVSIPRGSLVIPKKITQILQKLMKQKPQKLKRKKRK